MTSGGLGLENKPHPIIPGGENIKNGPVAQGDCAIVLLALQEGEKIMYKLTVREKAFASHETEARRRKSAATEPNRHIARGMARCAASSCCSRT